MAGLGTLRQLDLDHLDLRIGDLLGKSLRAEAAVGIAAAEIAAADFPDDVAAEFAVIAAEPAFSGVVREIAEPGALVEGENRVGAERAEAHRRDIEQRQRIGLTAIRAADQGAEIVSGRRQRRQRMIDPLELRCVDILMRAERPLVELPLRALIDHGALGAIERHAVGIAFQEILADLGADFFQQESEMGEDWIVAAQAVLGLHHIPEADQAEAGAYGEGDREQRAERDQQTERQHAADARNDRDIPHPEPPISVSWQPEITMARM